MLEVMRSHPSTRGGGGKVLWQAVAGNRTIATARDGLWSRNRKLL